MQCPQVWEDVAAQGVPRATAIDALGERIAAADAACSSGIEAALSTLVSEAMEVAHLDGGQVGGQRECTRGTGGGGALVRASRAVPCRRPAPAGSLGRGPQRGKQASSHVFCPLLQHDQYALATGLAGDTASGGGGSGAQPTHPGQQVRASTGHAQDGPRETLQRLASMLLGPHGGAGEDSVLAWMPYCCLGQCRCRKAAVELLQRLHTREVGLAAQRRAAWESGQNAWQRLRTRHAVACLCERLTSAEFSDPPSRQAVFASLQASQQQALGALARHIAGLPALLPPNMSAEGVAQWCAAAAGLDTAWQQQVGSCLAQLREVEVATEAGAQQALRDLEAELATYERAEQGAEGAMLVASEAVPLLSTRRETALQLIQCTEAFLQHQAQVCLCVCGACRGRGVGRPSSWHSWQPQPPL